METIMDAEIRINTVLLPSKYLNREVDICFFMPPSINALSDVPLLLINDGQDMAVMNFQEILHDLYKKKLIRPLVCVAISAGSERVQEYGIAGKKDYKNRGSKADLYTKFVTQELLPYVQKQCRASCFNEISFAGFSLGGLSALDIVWNHPNIFSKVGVFSGSLWWRSVDQNDPQYDDNKHRIMQQVLRSGSYAPGLKFFFQCGKLDESGDRNNNGVIDSIDDTLDHIKELIHKGYTTEDITYLELDDGKHDIATWGKSMPVFLKWGWGYDRK